MIIIRNDDVLLGSSGHPDAFNKFKQVHETICRSPRLQHHPGIIVNDIRMFPEAIEYIQHETWKRRMYPQVHGLSHIDYGKLSKAEVKEHLIKCCEWFQGTLKAVPFKWYTPWGANQKHLYEAAKVVNLQVHDCENVIKFKGRYGVKQLLDDGRPFSHFENREIIMHWWDSLDVERLTMFVDKLNEASSNH